MLVEVSLAISILYIFYDKKNQYQEKHKKKIHWKECHSSHITHLLQHWGLLMYAIQSLACFISVLIAL